MGPRSRRAVVVAAMALASGAAHAAHAQTGSAPRWPFSPHERLEYDVKFAVWGAEANIGTGIMEIAGVTTLDNHDVFHAVFSMKGGTFFFHVDDVMESWFDVRTLATYRFVEHLHEGGKRYERTYRIFPQYGTYQQEGKLAMPTVPDPLDDIAFMYFIRTQPLVVGESYTYARYFDPDANPVIVKVLRTERVSVPAGEFDAIVIQPLIKTSGIFSEGGRAEIWLANDSTRMVVQMKTKLNFGGIGIYLRGVTVGK
jgi:hypothetical protein